MISINKYIKTGIFTGIISLILMCVIALLRFGYEGLIKDEDNIFVLQYFVPVWAIAFGFSGFGLYRKYDIHKQSILGKDLKNYEIEKYIEWVKYRRMLFSKVFINIGKVTAFVLPVFILAFLDNSKYLSSNIKTVIILIIISCASFGIGIYLKKES
jgi:ethanolamine transporter EutH